MDYRPTLLPADYTWSFHDNGAYLVAIATVRKHQVNN